MVLPDIVEYRIRQQETRRIAGSQQRADPGRGDRKLGQLQGEDTATSCLPERLFDIVGTVCGHPPCQRGRVRRTLARALQHRDMRQIDLPVPMIRHKRAAAPSSARNERRVSMV